ncbi:hypothetical protein C1646_777926 [Rhizophagus diaphanus]|nr:hypothetical protein C1646_777926 [Rhizophagus diaphanus] [Rhizophagus sp. MUCL 43196]
MDICKVVSSIRNKNKINVRGYLMVKDKKRNNSYYCVLAGSSQQIGSHLPSHDALRQAVKQVRRANLPVEPQSFANLIIPDNLQKTLSGCKFLIRNLNIGDEKVLIFITSNNINYLSKSSFWIMDSTFKTVPTIFKQLYTIHRSVGDSENSQIMPLYVLTDFEKASINAVHRELHGIQNKGCHFYLFQSVYCKVQVFGLAAQYASDENISLFVRYISALAFLPCDNIPAVFNELRSNMPPDMPPEVNELLDWFEIYYVHRKNSVEAWHRRWKMLVGRAHVRLFKIIKELQNEQHQIKIKIESILQENP